MMGSFFLSFNSSQVVWTFRNHNNIFPFLVIPRGLIPPPWNGDLRHREGIINSPRRAALSGWGVGGWVVFYDTDITSWLSIFWLSIFSYFFFFEGFFSRCFAGHWYDLNGGPLYLFPRVASSAISCESWGVFREFVRHPKGDFLEGVLGNRSELMAKIKNTGDHSLRIRFEDFCECILACPASPPSVQLGIYSYCFLGEFSIHQLF